LGNVLYDEFEELTEFAEKREREKTRFSYVTASYTAFQVGRFLGTCKEKTFGKYLNLIGLGEKEKLTKEESEIIKKKSMAVVERVKKMKRVKKGKI